MHLQKLAEYPSIPASIRPAKPPTRLRECIDASLIFFANHRGHAHSLMTLYYFAAGDPFLRKIFDHIQEIGIRRIETYLVHNMSQPVPDHFGNSRRLFLKAGFKNR